jgi:predicted tellurium resistance membrane protein TerC
MPEDQRKLGRLIGIGLALILRVGFLASIAFIVTFTRPILSVYGHDFSWRDLMLIAGGLFLVWKATTEIHHRIDPDSNSDLTDREDVGLSFARAIGQIVVLDLVFSIDSIITAVGMTEHVSIMIIAVIVAMLIMLMAATPLANFIHANQTIVMLALGFLLMIGTVLIADGFGAKVSRGYIYVAMVFAALIEGLKMLERRGRTKRRNS